MLNRARIAIVIGPLYDSKMRIFGMHIHVCYFEYRAALERCHVRPMPYASDLLLDGSGSRFCQTVQYFCGGRLRYIACWRLSGPLTFTAYFSTTVPVGRKITIEY